MGEAGNSKRQDWRGRPRVNMARSREALEGICTRQLGLHWLFPMMTVTAVWKRRLGGDEERQARKMLQSLCKTHWRPGLGGACRNWCRRFCTVDLDGVWWQVHCERYASQCHRELVVGFLLGSVGWG